MVIKGLGVSKLKSLIPSLYQEAKVLVERMQEKCEPESGDCDISQPISMATMEMIGKTALGVRFNAQQDGHNKFVKAIDTLFGVCHLYERSFDLFNIIRLFQVFSYRMLHPWYLNDTLFHLSPLKRDNDRCVKFIAEFVDEIIKSKIVELNHTQKSANLSIDDENVHQMPKTVLEILLQHSHEMSYKQIRNEIVTIITGKYYLNIVFL